MATSSQRLSSSQKNSLSQQKSPSALGSLLTMPLAKFSYATTSGLQSKPSWTHLPNRDNMYAVFDLVRSKGSGDSVNQRDLLKVVRGSDLLESIDLVNLRQQALQDEERAGSMILQESERLVIVLVKSPLVAIRYPLPNGQVRKIQMRFAKESDYTMTVSFLQRLELPIGEPRPASMPRTPINDTSSTAQLRPISAESHSHERVSSGQQGSVPPSLHHDTAAWSSSMMLGSSPYPVSSSSHISGFAQPSAALHRSISMFDRGSRDELPPPAGPSSSSTILDPGPNLRLPQSTPAGPLRSPYSSPSATIPGNLPGDSSVVASRLTVERVHEGSALSIDSASSMPRRALFEKELAEAQHSLNTTVDNHDTLDQLLPPKRELPFAKFDPKPPRRHTLPVLEDSSGSDELEMPEPAKNQTSKPKTKAKAKAPAFKANRPVLFSTDLSPTDLNSDRLTTSYRPTSAPSTITDTLTYVLSSSPPLAIAPGHRSLAALPASEENARQNNPRRPQGPTEPTTNPSGDHLPDEYWDRIRVFLNKHHDRAAAEKFSDDAAADRAAYAALPEEERLAALDAEIVECIMDDNFLQLCKDVEKSWKRVALGF